MDQLTPDIGPTTAAVPQSSIADPEMTRYLHAYRLASDNKDSDAMNELHGYISKRQGELTSAMSNPTAGTGGVQQFMEGTGHGMQRMVQGLGNAVNLPGEFFSNQRIKNEDETSQPLLKTGAGMAGDLAGQVAATAPMGMGSGGLLKALGAAGKLGGTAGRVLTRAALAAGENGLQSVGMGDVDKQSDSLAEGAGLGAGLSLLGGVGGKALRGLVGKNEAAQRLYVDAENAGKDIFIPISQGGTGLAKGTYQHALPYALGVETKLANQSRDASSVISDIAREQHGAPEQILPSGAVERVKLPAAQTGEQGAADLKDVYNKAYDQTVKQHAFAIPSDFRDRVVASLKSGHPELGDVEAEHIGSTLDELMQRKLGKGTSINGAQLTDLLKNGRSQLDGLAAGKGIGNEATTNTAIGNVHNLVSDAIADHQSMLPTLRGPQRQQAEEVIRDLGNFQRLGDSYGEGRAVIATAGKNIPNRGAIKWGTLANEAPPSSPLRALAQDAHEVLDQTPGAVSPAGRHLVHAGTAISSLWHPGILPAVAAGIGAGNLMATKGVQKTLYGDTATQQAIARLLRNNPQAAYSAGMAGRETADNATR